MEQFQIERRSSSKTVLNNFKRIEKALTSVPKCISECIALNLKHREYKHEASKRRTAHHRGKDFAKGFKPRRASSVSGML